jgi:hypothetical protein
VQQLQSIKATFTKETRVSLDAIILQQIAIENFKQNPYFGIQKDMKSWPYALHNDLINQLEIQDVDSNEFKEIIKLLKSQINLADTPPYKWSQNKTNESNAPFRKSCRLRYLLSEELITQLRETREHVLINYR